MKFFLHQTTWQCFTPITLKATNHSGLQCYLVEPTYYYWSKLLTTYTKAKFQERGKSFINWPQIWTKETLQSAFHYYLMGMTSPLDSHSNRHVLWNCRHVHNLSLLSQIWIIYLSTKIRWALTLGIKGWVSFKEKSLLSQK